MSMEFNGGGESVLSGLKRSNGDFVSSLFRKLSEGDPKSSGSTAVKDDRYPGPASNLRASSQSNDTAKARQGGEKDTPKNEGLGPRIDLVINAINDAVTQK